jgi:RNA polymerase sigma factor (sigma-70 family)
MLDNPIQPGDEELVRACRQGEAAAWELLINRYQRLIYTIPRRSGLDEEQAADVFQLTFTRLLEHLDRIEQPGRIRAWLVTTARRETWRLMRQQSVGLEYPDSGEPPDELDQDDRRDDALLPDEEIERLEEQHLIRTAIAALDERARQLLTLLFYGPAPPPYAEVAAALGIPEGSLGPTRARCLQKLRCKLEDLGF